MSLPLQMHDLHRLGDLNGDILTVNRRKLMLVSEMEMSCAYPFQCSKGGTHIFAPFPISTLFLRKLWHFVGQCLFAKSEQGYRKAGKSSFSQTGRKWQYWYKTLYFMKTQKCCFH